MNTSSIIPRDALFVVVSFLVPIIPYPKLAEKERREGTEKVYDERMDMIMEVSRRTFI